MARFRVPTLAGDVDPTEFISDIDPGSGDVWQVDAFTVVFNCGSAAPGTLWSCTGLFAPGCAPTSGTLAPDPLTAYAAFALMIPHGLIFFTTNDVDGLTIDLSKIKVDGVPATVATSGGPASFEIDASNPAWPVDTTGHTLTLEAGWVPGEARSEFIILETF